MQSPLKRQLSANGFYSSKSRTEINGTELATKIEPAASKMEKEFIEGSQCTNTDSSVLSLGLVHSAKASGPTLQPAAIGTRSYKGDCHRSCKLRINGDRRKKSPANTV